MKGATTRWQHVMGDGVWGEAEVGFVRAHDTNAIGYGNRKWTFKGD